MTCSIPHESGPRSLLKTVPSAFIAGVFFSGSLFGGCRSRKSGISSAPPPPPAPPVQKGPGTESIAVTGEESVYRDAKGRILWTVKAESGGVRIAQMRVDLKKPDCTLYAENRPAWRCRADVLTAEKPTEQVTLRGNVVGRSADGQRSFAAPVLTWNVKTGAITGGPGVRLRMGLMEMEGDRLEASSVNKKGRVIGHAHGRILR
jgi:LPS export ABC transporter protein LptC